ncbi:MAG: hypothetical protein P8Y71_18175 [Pseudolabrys sp.]
MDFLIYLKEHAPAVAIESVSLQEVPIHVLIAEVTRGSCYRTPLRRNDVCRPRGSCELPETVVLGFLLIAGEVTTKSGPVLRDQGLGR